MNDVDDLVAWLREQIAEDRRVAEEACDGPWHVNDAGYAESIYSADGTCVVGGGRWGGEAPVFDSTEDALHIVRHDPRAVLTQCDAHEAILNGYQKLVDEDAATPFGDPDQRSAFYQYETVVLPALALAYQHQPGYREEWRP